MINHTSVLTSASNPPPQPTSRTLKPLNHLPVPLRLSRSASPALRSKLHVSSSSLDPSIATFCRTYSTRVGFIRCSNANSPRSSHHWLESFEKCEISSALIVEKGDGEACAAGAGRLVDFVEDDDASGAALDRDDDAKQDAIGRNRLAVLYTVLCLAQPFIKLGHNIVIFDRSLLVAPATMTDFLDCQSRDLAHNHNIRSLRRLHSVYHTTSTLFFSTFFRRYLQQV